MKKHMFLYVSSTLILLTVSCASTSVSNASKNSEIIMTQTGDTMSEDASVDIDGNKVGTIKLGERKIYKIENGKHTFRIYVPSILSYGWDSGIEQIELTNSRLEVEIRNYHITTKKETKLLSTEIQPSNTTFSDKALTQVIKKSFNTLANLIPDKSTVAVVNIATNPSDGEFLIEELNILLVNSKKYTIVDRRSLDSIRNEHNFQRSGEVDDEQVVDIGKMAGANIVITGNISTSSKTSRLRLKALDVKTAEIVAMSSEIIK